jgi:ABC-type Fe3+/spermidine/putrescine transport system ATPase subunit
MDDCKETTPMSSAQVEFQMVSQTYGERRVLNDVSFIIPTGAHTAILGPSGCGKSTVLHLLAGLDAPSAGKVLLDGRVVSQPNKVVRPPYQRGIAMVFQDLALWPTLSAKDNIFLGLSGAGLTRQEAQQRVGAALALCAIESLADRKPGMLSGGEQQRVALARAIAVQPTYLLLDEPFAGLDLITKAALLKEIAGLVAARHITIVLVTHDPLEATVLCSSVLVLKGGQVEEAGMLNDLLRTSQSEMLSAFRAQLSSAVFDP